MADVRIRIDDKGTKDALRKLARDGTRQTLVDAFKRVGFDARDALRAHISETFDGPRTPFLAKSIRFNVRARGTSRVRLEVFPLRKSAAILVQHVPGAQPFRAETGGRIAVDTPRGRRLAIPAQNTGRGSRGPRLPVLRTRSPRSGKVPKAKLPATLLARGGRGFISRSGNALLVRGGRRGRTVRIAYVLEDVGRNPGVLRFTATAVDAIRRGLPAATGRALDKARARVMR